METTRSRPTELVDLWLSNDEGLYHAVNELTASTEDEYELADAIKELLESTEEYETAVEHASFVSDLLGCAWSEVDWRRIARDWRESA
jgi:hypothetical protein